LPNLLWGSEAFPLSLLSSQLDIDYFTQLQNIDMASEVWENVSTIERFFSLSICIIQFSSISVIRCQALRSSCKQ
jgi:hypothetical protein